MKCYRMGMRLALAGALALAGLGLASPARAGSVCYLVTADTTGLATTSGFLEVQLNASAAPASASVTATISNVSTDGALGTVSYNNGATGSFSSTPAVMDNTTFGDLQQNFTYGKTLSFEITLSGSEINPSSAQPFTGTVFSFLLEDSTGAGLNTGGSGQALDIFVNQGAGPNTQADTYAPTPGAYPVVTVGPCAIVPEPSSVILMGLGMGVVATFGRFRKTR